MTVEALVSLFVARSLQNVCNGARQSDAERVHKGKGMTPPPNEPSQTHTCAHAHAHGLHVSVRIDALGFGRSSGSEVVFSDSACTAV